MLTRKLVAALAAINLAAPLWAADAQQTPTKEQAKEQSKEQIYGSQLMTPQERRVYRTRMRAAKTQEEREQIRREHHEQMKARAKERGMTLPDEPPMPGGGMGPGMGPGGGGMGPGRNR